MAALRQWPSGLVAPASSNSRLNSWPPRSVLRMQSGNMSPSLRHSHRIRAHMGAAGQPVNPDPGKDVRGSAEYKKFMEEFRKLNGAPQDMPFREEWGKIDEYLEKISNTSILHREATALSCYLCTTARNAVSLASRVMECALSRLGAPGGISPDTIKQTVKMYVCIFVNTAEDSYQKRVTKETIVSFLGALEGLAAISHILVQDTLANLDNTNSSSSYSTNSKIDKARHEFQGKMNNLKHIFSAPSADAYELLWPTLTDAIIHTHQFVALMIWSYHNGTCHIGAAPDDDGESTK